MSFSAVSFFEKPDLDPSRARRRDIPQLCLALTLGIIGDGAYSIRRLGA